VVGNISNLNERHITCIMPHNASCCKLHFAACQQQSMAGTAMSPSDCGLWVSEVGSSAAGSIPA
jgi:hypothetical protein